MMTSFKNEYDLLAIYFSNKNDKTTIRNVDAAKDCFVLLSFSEVSLVIVGIPAVERGCTKSAVEGLVGTESSPRIEPLTA